MGKKVITIFLVIILCFAMFIPIMSYAVDTGLGDLDQYGGGSGGSSRELQEKAETILGVIQVIGVVVSVAMLIVIGPYLIGAFMVFSVTTIPQIIYRIAKNL